MMLSPLLAEIKRYTESVLANQFCCDLERCPRCEKEPGAFRRHALRARAFLVVVGAWVKKAPSFLTRWKCPLCNETFTLYPAFAVPHKRYVQASIFAGVHRYLDADRTTYRQAAQREDRPIFFEGDAADPLDDRTLAPSTIHRWIVFLAGLGRTLRTALRLIREKSPCADIFRRLFPVGSWTYRSLARKHELQTALQLFAVEASYRALFGPSTFTELATAWQWT
jgi:hypothetical protein